jgi:predicted ATP-grasp superfamily ATP-dependent carboligase
VTIDREGTKRDGRPVLIAALSGRALAAAAHRAGVPTIVLDRFADQDTAQLATRVTALPPPPDFRGRRGFARRPFLAALRALQGQVQGLVYGAGFEHDPALLAEAAKILPILGNRPEVVADLKDPFRFAALLANLKLRHPPVRREPPSEPGWLRKAAGGSGGAHITRAGRGRMRPGTYFQKAVPGRSVSAAFVADGRSTCVVGFTEQWPSETTATPFRYGGCAGPVRLPPKLASTIATACSAIAGAAGLVGLNSLDMLIDGREFHILEVNPRPGASLDVLDGLHGWSLWRLHHDALAGRLPKPRRGPSPTRAAEIVYAPWRCAIPARFAWPAWSADRGRPGTVIGRGEPICTVMAGGATAAVARQRACALRARLLDRLPPLNPGVPHAEEAALA